MSYKLYSIIPSTSKGETIEVVTKMMKTPFSKYPKDLPLKNEKRADKYYPSRIVTSSFATSSFTGFGLYKLTDAEAASIKNDPLISNVLLISTRSYDDNNSGYFPETGSEYPESGSLLSSIPDRNFRPFPWPEYTDDIDTANLSNIATYYHSLPLDKMYSGSFGKETSRALGNNPDVGQIYTGNTFQPQGIQAFTNNHDYNYSVDGKDVDFIHWENNGGQEWNHAEYHGVDGNSRVNFVNWEKYGAPPYGPSSYETQIPGSTHKQQCIMNAVGLTSGFAKGANIFYIGVPTPYSYSKILEQLNIIKLWDATKPINPKTGRRNRTVLNTSHYFSDGMVPPYSKLTPSFQRISGSVDIGSPLLYSSIRFEGLKLSPLEPRRDYVFAIGTTSTTRLAYEINKTRGAANIYLTGSYIPSGWGYPGYGVENSINTILNPTSDALGWTASIDGNTLHFTSSGGTNDIFGTPMGRYNPLRIYTGSIYDFMHSNDILATNQTSPPYSINSPRGGALVFEESSSTSPKTGISKIVVKGNLIYTGSTDPVGSNGYLNSNHGFYQNPVVDWYGIDRGVNINTNNIAYSLKGLHRGIGSEHTPSLSQALKECAEQGIIILQAAGNSPIPYTMESSSLEENPLYDPDLYSDDLYNTYVEYDTEWAGYDTSNTFPNGEFRYLPEGPVPPNTPIRLGNPQWTSNYSTIQIGMMDHQSYASFWNSPENQKTMSGSVYGGSFPQNITKDRIHPQTRKAHGKAISAYAIGGSTVIGGTSGSFTLSSGDHGYIAHSSSFYNTIKFNTSSILSAYKYQSQARANSITGSYGIPIFTQGLYTIGRGGGTSFSSPLVAGMICCYLEVNPDASFVDVRNWLHNTGMKEVPGTLSDPNKYYHLGRYETSSIHPAYYNDLYMDSGGIDFGGRNPVIAHFPYNSPMRGKLSNITMSRS
tara:strand:+ start:5881 stop:8676 length:2796 start_codon:yes stop_codon:yes gene_type:complete